MTNNNLGATHGAVETSLMLATDGGAHILNLRAHEDIDNGNVVALGDYDSKNLDVWYSKSPSATDHVFLVGTSVVIYEDYTEMFQDEARFYNAKDDVMRCYDMKPYDKFAISKEALGTNADDVAIGKYLILEAGKTKLQVADAPGDGAFAAYVYDIATNGKYRAMVHKNA